MRVDGRFQKSRDLSKIPKRHILLYRDPPPPKKPLRGLEGVGLRSGVGGLGIKLWGLVVRAYDMPLIRKPFARDRSLEVQQCTKHFILITLNPKQS